jgi:hypothetical protein
MERVLKKWQIGSLVHQNMPEIADARKKHDNEVGDYLPQSGPAESGYAHANC